MKDSERIRIAIALIALRHKPADQSCASYALELQQWFPPRTRKPTADPAEASGPWRVRAQELELALQDLQRKYDTQLVGEYLAAAKVTPPLSISEPDTTPSCPAPTPVPGKKKSKKKANPDPVSQGKKTNETSRPDSMRSSWTHLQVPELSGPNQLLSSIEALDVLLDARRRCPSEVTIDACALAATRAMDAVALTLGALLPPATPSASTSGVIQGLSTLVTRLLLTTVPVLSAPPRKKADTTATDRHLDALLGTLVTSTLLPLLSSFHALSLAHLTALLRPAPKAKDRPPRANHDARPDALGFLRATLQTLTDLARPQSGRPAPTALLAGVHEAVVRAAVRELEKLYVPAEPDAAAAPAGERAIGGSRGLGTSFPAMSEPQAHRATHEKTKEKPPPAQQDAVRGARLEKLAHRDTLWYLCAVLHAAIPGASALAEEGQNMSTALREGVCTALAGLLRMGGVGEGGEGAICEGPVGDRRDGRVQCTESTRGRGRGLLGGVEREMLLAVAEKLWLSQG